MRLTKRGPWLGLVLLAVCGWGCARPSSPAWLTAPPIVITAIDSASRVARLQSATSGAVTMDVPRGMRISDLVHETRVPSNLVVTISDGDDKIFVTVAQTPDASDVWANYDYSAAVLDPQQRWRKIVTEHYRSNQEAAAIEVVVYAIDTKDCTAVANLVACPDQVVTEIPGGTSTVKFGRAAERIELMGLRRDNGWLIGAGTDMAPGKLTIHDLLVMIASITIDPAIPIPAMPAAD